MAKKECNPALFIRTRAYYKGSLESPEKREIFDVASLRQDDVILAQLVFQADGPESRLDDNNKLAIEPRVEKNPAPNDGLRV